MVVSPVNPIQNVVIVRMAIIHAVQFPITMIPLGHVLQGHGAAQAIARHLFPMRGARAVVRHPIVVRLSAKRITVNQDRVV